MKINEFDNLKLLYVEDERNIRNSAMSYFKRFFNNVFEAEDAFKAFEIFKEQKPDIIITDIRMTQMSGIDLVKKIRTIDTSCQIIILTAFTDKKYLFEAVELNLVKYLVKPIRHDNMYEALCQCAKNLKSKGTELLKITQECVYDIGNKALLNGETTIKLSKTELDFIELLATNANRVVSYIEIENHVWQDSVMSEDAIRSLVRKLRKKLPSDSLKNIAKVGYKLQCL